MVETREEPFAGTRPYWIMPGRELERVAHDAAQYEAIAADGSRSWATRQNAVARAGELRRRLRPDAAGREVMAMRQRAESEAPQQAPAQQQEYMPTRRQRALHPRATPTWLGSAHLSP